MKAGISTASLFLRLNNEDAVPLFAEWGVETSEVFLTSFSEYSPAFAKKLAGKKGSLSVHSVHVLNTQFEPQLYAEHPRVRADAFKWLGKAMLSAQVLSATHYTFHGIARIKRSFREDIARTAALTEEISSYCEKFGVQLCYENVEWAFFNRPELFAALKSACPNLGGVLDIKQAKLSGYPWQDYLKAMGQSLTHVHVSDRTTSGELCLPGKGSFDFDELFRALKGEGFDGAVILENYARDYSELKELKEAYLFLKEKVEKFG